MTVEELEIIIRANITDAMSGIKKITDEVKQCVSNSVEPMKKMTNQAKEMASRSSSSVSQMKQQIKSYANDVNSTAKQQEYLKSKIEDLKMSLDKADMGFEVGDTMKIEADIERLENKLHKLEAQSATTGKKTGGIFSQIGEKIKGASSKVADYVKKIKGASSNTNKFGSSISKTFSKGIGSIKKFALALLSVRSAFSVISKAMSSYLSYDTQLADSIQNCWNVLGSLLAPILERLVSLFSTLVSYVNAFVKALTGIDLVAKANAKSLNKQSKASKDASKQLSGIDDLNNLSSDKDSGSGNNPITTEDIDKSSALFEELMKIKDLISNGDWGGLAKILSEDIIKGLDYVSTKIKSINWSGIGKGISDFLTNIDFSGIMVGLVKVFGEAVLGFQDLILNIDWATVLANFSTGLADSIMEITYYLTQIDWNSLGLLLSNSFTSINWVGIGNSILNLIWQGLSGLVKLFLSINWSEVGKTISDAVHSWIENIITKFKETDWVQLGMDIANAIMDFILSINWGQLGIDILKGLWEGLKATLGLIIGFFGTLLERILEFFGIHSPSTVFADMGKNMIAGLVNGLKSVISTVINVFATLWNTLKNGAKNAWEGIKSIFSTVASFFKNTFSNAWNAVKNVFSTGGKIFSGIKDGIFNAFKAVVNTLIAGINKVVAIPFNAINSALKTVRDISFLGISPFKGLIKLISVPQIPSLATGAVLDDETIVRVAEYSNAKSNPEIVSPRDIMADTFKGVLEEADFGTRIDRLTLKVLDETVYDGAIEYINEQSKIKGVSVIKGVG